MVCRRFSICVRLAALLMVLVCAPSVLAQPLKRIASLDDPLAASPLPSDELMPSRSPVPPRTAYQPDPDLQYNDFASPRAGAISVVQSPNREYKIANRYGTRNDYERVNLPDGSYRYLLVGGWILNVASRDGTEAAEFAADNIVIWTRGSNPGKIENGFSSTEQNKTEVEVYLSGDVVIRTTRGAGANKVTQTLRAEEIYYDAERNRAIAIHADLEMAIPGVQDPLRLTGNEVRRLDLENWDILQASVNASKLPSDPGLRLDSKRFTLSERRVVRRNIFGIPFRDLRTGEQVEYHEQIVTGSNVVTRVNGLPVMYLPRVRLDATDPFGPLDSVGFSSNRMFGAQFTTTWDFYELLALRPPPQHKWRLNLDYLTKRGPAVGSDYLYTVPGDYPGDPPLGLGYMQLYGIADNGFDLLGGPRGISPMPPYYRGRATWRHQQELTDSLYFQGQLSLLSDMNFLEQYYKNEFDFGPNQESFAYLAWQRRNFGATALVEDRLNRQWVSETNWLPRVDGHLIGQTFFDDLFVYSARGTAGYAQARPTKYLPYPLLPTDQRVDVGRFGLWQELSAPFPLGPLKVAPYGVLDLTEYTNDLNGNEVGRIYGGGGARASLPFSRLYSEANSELLNLRGLYHKVILGANYRYARSNVPFSQLPLLDRLNDDATDQTWRNITPIQPSLVPGPNGLLLAGAPGYSPFNPQLYAIRRVVENRLETLDDINVLQLDLRQRLQTKRGYPGMEHTVDFLTFDVSASYFPDANRDNFGNPFAFLEYAGVWNVGDRTALVSSGWFEPYENGSRYWTAGMHLSRTDRTSFYAGYRQTDPLNSKAVTATVSYQLSHRYFVNVGATYDFGLQQALSNSFTLTRTGSDMTVSLGFTYTAFVNNFGFQFIIVPNLLAPSTINAAGAPINTQAIGRR